MAQRDIVGSVFRLIFLAEVSSEISSDMAQRDIVGSELRLIFSADVSSEISSKYWPNKSFLY